MSWLSDDLKYDRSVFWKEETLAVTAYMDTESLYTGNVKPRQIALLNQDIMDDLRGIHKAFEGRHGVLEEMFPAGSSCAVVGNSGNLLGSNYGTLIDSFDVVIRMNEAPTETFEKDVGNKLHIRILHPKVLIGELRNIPEEPFYDLVTFFNKEIGIRHMQRFVEYDPNNVDNSINTLSMLDNHYMQWVQRYTINVPSTGMYATFMALTYCDKVDLFGFGADENGNWDHYFFQWQTKYTANNPFGWHSSLREKIVLDALEGVGAITIHPGSRPRT